MKAITKSYRISDQGTGGVVRLANTRSLLVSVITTLVLLVTAPAAFAREQSKVASSFENSGADDSAQGSIKSSFKDKRSKLSIRVSGLDDDSNYHLMVQGIEQAQFRSKSGKARLTFSGNGSGRTLPLDFDPRNKLVSIENESETVLKTVFNGAGDSVDSVVRENTALVPTDLAPGGKAEAEYKRKAGRSAYKIEIEDVPAGDYDVYVNSILVGTLTVDGKGNGEIEFDTEASPPKLPLTFDPRGQTVDVLRNGEVFFSSVMLAKIGGVNSCNNSESVKTLVSTGVDGDAHAEARYKTGGECEREFDVEVEDLPVGSYDVLVDGILRGSINVVDSTSGTRGELEFSSDSDDSNKLPLNFDPSNKTITILQGGTTFFSDSFAGGDTVVAVCDVVNNEVALINSGVNASAKGKARFRQESDCRQDLRVEIEDLPAGFYSLNVGGSGQGSINVTTVNGELQGEIEFDTRPSTGEVLLDFDPRGQLIEVLQGSTVVLSRSLPN